MSIPQPTQTKWGNKIPVDVEAARKVHADNPRSFMHGKVQQLIGDGFTARYWKQEKHVAVITHEDANTEELRASSAADLGEKLQHLQANLLVQRRQATVNVLPAEEVWIAEIVTDDVTHRTEAPTREDLMKKVMSLQADAKVALDEHERVPQREHLPWDYICDLVQKQQIQIFLDSCPEYRPTNRNLYKLENWLTTHKKDWTYQNLLAAFDELFDQGELDEHGQEIDEKLEAEYLRQLEAR